MCDRGTFMTVGAGGNLVQKGVVKNNTLSCVAVISTQINTSH